MSVGLELSGRVGPAIGFSWAWIDRPGCASGMVGLVSPVIQSVSGCISRTMARLCSPQIQGGVKCRMPRPGVISPPTARSGYPDPYPQWREEWRATGTANVERACFNLSCPSHSIVQTSIRPMGRLPASISYPLLEVHKTGILMPPSTAHGSLWPIHNRA
jgi:hypothetical protein